ncbi:MAG: redoxin domain-containing protein [Planctomycetes bacterium]|nr:redoxin domain-containing protein [Planctomycetota bacterium]
MTIRCTALAVMLLALGVGAGLSQEKKYDMTPINYEGLKQELLKHRGKVVIVDFWASNCPPCREKFPLFIKLHEKHHGKGLVVMSVSIDPAVHLDPNDVPEGIASANKFLQKQQPPFRNFLLDEPVAVVTKQFDYKGLPFYYFFDRQGKWIRFRGADIPYDKLDDIVVKMLGEK